MFDVGNTVGIAGSARWPACRKKWKACAPRWTGSGAAATGSVPSSSGNRAFDDYRSETLKRLEDEQREFKDFLERLRFAKDRAEFDHFMAARRRAPWSRIRKPSRRPNRATDLRRVSAALNRKFAAGAIPEWSRRLRKYTQAKRK